MYFSERTHILFVIVVLSFSSFAQFRDINPFPAHNVGNLKELFLVAPNEIFIKVIGQYGTDIKTTYLKSQDSGYSWQYINIGPYDGVEGRCYNFGKDSFFLIVAAYIVSFDGFKTYVKVGSKPSSSGYIRGLYINNQDFFITYDNGFYDTVGTFKSTDIGKTWKQVCDTAIREIEFIDTKTGYGIGYGKISYPRIFKTTDGGNSWFDLHSQNDTGGSYEFRFKEHFYSLSSKSELRRSDDEGKSWKIKDGKLPSDFKFVNAHKFLSATTGIVYNYKYGVYKTTNAGDSWEKLSDYISTSPVSRIYSLLQNGKVYIILAEYNNAKTSMVYGVFDSAAIFTNSLPEQKTKTQFYIYPNPTKNNVTISYTGFVSSDTKIRLFDMQGKLLKEQSFGLGETVVNLENFSNGVYILKIFEDKGVFVHKIIKE